MKRVTRRSGRVAELTPESLGVLGADMGTMPLDAWRFDSSLKNSKTREIWLAPGWSFGHSVAIADSSLVIEDGDGIGRLLVSAGAGNRTVTLPTAADNEGRTIEVWKTDTGVGEVIVDGEGAETVNGTPYWNLNEQFQRVRLVSDGTGWLAESPLGTLRRTRNVSTVGQAAATVATWYWPGPITLVVEAGVWDLSLQVSPEVSTYSVGIPTWVRVLTALTTDGATSGEVLDTRTMNYEHTPLDLTWIESRFARTQVTLAGSTTFTLGIYQSNSAGRTATINFRGDLVPTILEARRIA